MTKNLKDTQKTLDQSIALFNKQQDQIQQLETMLNQVLVVMNSQLANPIPLQPTTTTIPPDSFQVKLEEWEKKLDQILQGSTPPPPPPTTTNPITSTPSTPKIPAPTPFNGISEDVSPAINRIRQYVAILIGQYPDMRLGDLVHRVLILLQHLSTTQWVNEARLRYFTSTNPSTLMTLFAEFETEFGDQMKQEKAREWVASCKQSQSNVSEYACNFKHQAHLAGYKDLNPLIATFCSGMNTRLAEDVI
ncbi:hypothetical protein AX16_009450 [Volvariella volvacea WC 439]|nr:hypothetical protein AX16_009450 [Volvariella volvacea WC 439]